jgi:hypothetical protein
LISKAYPLPEVLVDDVEVENMMLNERIKELEHTLMQAPIFSNPVSTVQPWKSIDKTPESSLKLKGTSSLLFAIRCHIGENIYKKRISLILETWDLASSFVSLGSRVQKFREYLHLV